MIPDMRRSRDERDAGFSLVEVVITIVLIGIVIVPLMSAVITSIRVSAISHSAAQAETALVNAADRVNRAPSGRCDYGPYARAAVQSQGWPPGNAVVEHAYWEANPDGDPFTNDGTWVAQACPSGVVNPPSNIVQRVTITVTSPDGRAQRTTEVVKSDV